MTASIDSRHNLLPYDSAAQNPYAYQYDYSYRPQTQKPRMGLRRSISQRLGFMRSYSSPATPQPSAPIQINITRPPTNNHATSPSSPSSQAPLLRDLSPNAPLSRSQSLRRGLSKRFGSYSAADPAAKRQEVNPEPVRIELTDMPSPPTDAYLKDSGTYSRESFEGQNAATSSSGGTLQPPRKKNHRWSTGGIPTTSNLCDVPEDGPAQVRFTVEDVDAPSGGRPQATPLQRANTTAGVGLNRSSSIRNLMRSVSSARRGRPQMSSRSMSAPAKPHQTIEEVEAEEEAAEEEYEQYARREFGAMMGGFECSDSYY